MHPNAEAIHAHLTEAFQHLEIDPVAVYVNQIADVIDEQVILSRTLLDEALHHLEQGREPTYDIGLCGLFSEPDTFDPALRVRQLRLQDFEREIGRMLLAG